MKGVWRNWSLLAAMALLLSLPLGCGDKKKETSAREKVAVEYEIDRQFDWNPELGVLSGVITLQFHVTGREFSGAVQAYGMAFELEPGERTTVIVKIDPHGRHYNGEFPELPVRLPFLLSARGSGAMMDMFDYDVRAVGEIALSQVPYDNRYYLTFSFFDVNSTWLHSIHDFLPADEALLEERPVSFARGRAEFERGKAHRAVRPAEIY